MTGDNSHAGAVADQLTDDQQAIVEGDTDTDLCDRCGDDLAESFFGGNEGITLSQTGSWNDWHLCSECQDAFLDFIHDADERRKDVVVPDIPVALAKDVRDAITDAGIKPGWVEIREVDP